MLLIYSTGQMIYDNHHTIANVARFIFTQIAALARFVFTEIFSFTKFVFRHINPPPERTIPDTVDYPISIPRMSHPRLQAIEDRVVNEPWAQGREIVVNQESNTISVFGVHEEDCENQHPPVPLFYDDIPIIPHSCPYRKSDLNPKELNTSLDKVRDGLTQEQLWKLKDYFIGVITVEYYLDKQVVITIAQQWYDTGFFKVGGSEFWAWGCFVVLLCAVEKQDVEIVPDIDNRDSIVSEDIVPGSKVYNENGEYSTVGALLYERSQLSTAAQHYPAGPITVDYFTVSAHSFVKKIYAGIGMNWRCAVVLPFVSQVAYAGMTQSLFNMLLIKQVLLTRLFVLFYDFIWIYAGRPCGLHTKVLLYQIFFNFAAGEGLH